MQFNQVPTAVRVPFAYVEFSNTESNQGSTVQPYKILLLGQKLGAGTQPVHVPVRIQSNKQARTLFGLGSMLSDMVEASLKANSFTETWAIALADDDAGVAAASTVTVTGTATADGTLSLYVGDKLVRISVLTGQTAAQIATALNAAINSTVGLMATSTVAAAVVTLTHRHKGAFGTNMPIMANYYGEEYPAGVTLAVAATVAGTANPSIEDALFAIGDEQFRTIVTPYNDLANLRLLGDELTRRWGPLLTNDAHAFAATPLSSSAAADELGLELNNPHITVLHSGGSPTPSWKVAAALGAIVAQQSPIDQGRPLQTLTLPGVLPAPLASRPILEERNMLLYNGIATTTVDAGGSVRIERLITTYREDAVGNLDESYLDYETMAILSYLRYDFRAYFQKKYPRHKLGMDGGRYAPGQAVMTPKVAKAEAVGLFDNWEAMGLVENGAQFREEIRVEINPQNPNRLDFYLPPNLINGLRILAAQIAFRA